MSVIRSDQNTLVGVMVRLPLCAAERLNQRTKPRAKTPTSIQQQTGDVRLPVRPVSAVARSFNGFVKSAVFSSAFQRGDVPKDAHFAPHHLGHPNLATYGVINVPPIPYVENDSASPDESLRPSVADINLECSRYTSISSPCDRVN